GISDMRPDLEYFRLVCETYDMGIPDQDIGDEGGESESPQRYSYLSVGELDENSDMIFMEHIGISEYMIGGISNRGLFFTDRTFSGSSYTVSLKFDRAYFEASGPELDDALLDCGIRFTLMTVSRSYYDRINYLWQKNSGIIGEMADMGLADPIWGYSNVSSGAGVVAAQAITTYDLNLKDFLYDTIKNIIEEEGDK
ncbi:MAG: DUF4249 domain-containing protein, partial [Muribaculaceae bacterium]|nr:DUF4249 domain-containing protein [Muribaculaceae bacterium]